MKVYTITEDKASVQDYYVNIILKAFQKKGYETLRLNSIQEAYKLPKNSILLSISHFTTLKLALRGFKNILYWVQGSSPDESYMRNHSIVRRKVLSFIEFLALKKAKYIFMVSMGMLQYYNNKYNTNFTNKTYVMPCYNSRINKGLFYMPEKYQKNVFCYVGGLSIWQCFPKTVKLYKQIEESLPNCLFKVFTGDQDEAINILKSYNIKNYEVKYVDPSKLVDELAMCKFGFILREQSPVNLVATPTKLSNYMAAGLIPIVSNSVSFFNEMLANSPYAIILDGYGDSDKIISLANSDISTDHIYNEFNMLFEQYYNDEKHILNISSIIKHLEL